MEDSGKVAREVASEHASANESIDKPLLTDVATANHSFENLTIDTSNTNNVENEILESGTPLFRKVLCTLEEEDNCCSICLDEFTIEDPSMTTTCG